MSVGDCGWCWVLVICFVCCRVVLAGLGAWCFETVLAGLVCACAHMVGFAGSLDCDRMFCG